MQPVLVLHGPNLNLLGEREPGVYGATTMAAINQSLVALGEELGLGVRAEQENSEGALINLLHDARTWSRGVVFNPGAYTHTSVALRDAVAAIYSAQRIYIGASGSIGCAIESVAIPFTYACCLGCL